MASLRHIISLQIILFFLQPTLAQSKPVNGEGRLVGIYSLPYGVDGFLRVEVIVKYKLSRFSGSLVIGASVECRDIAQYYRYKGVEYVAAHPAMKNYRDHKFTGADVQFSIKGSGFNKNVLIDVVKGGGSGEFGANSRDLGPIGKLTVDDFTVSIVEISKVSYTGMENIHRDIDKYEYDKKKANEPVRSKDEVTNSKSQPSDNSGARTSTSPQSGSTSSARSTSSPGATTKTTDGNRAIKQSNSDPITAPYFQDAKGNYYRRNSDGTYSMSNRDEYERSLQVRTPENKEAEREAKQRADRKTADSINRVLEESGRNWDLDMQRRQRESDEMTALASRSFYTATAVSDAENNFKSNSKLANRYESVEELERDYQAKLSQLSQSADALATAKNQNLQAGKNYAFRDADAAGQAVGQLAVGIGSIINNISAEKQEQRAREKLAADRAAAQKLMEAEKKALILSVRRKLVQDFPEGGSPLSSHRVGTNEVYLFAYWMDTTQFSQPAPVVRVTNVFPVGQRSDGTWPFKSSLSQDLTKLVPQPATMFGYFASRDKAVEWHEAFKRLASKSEMKVSELAFTGRPAKGGPTNGVTERPAPTTDFFGNPIQQSPVKEQSAPATKDQSPPAGKKQKLDFFGNPIKE